MKVSVEENSTRARYSQANNPVILDSCFELIIGSDYCSFYYKFDFKQIDTSYFAFATPVNGELAPIETMNSIRFFSSLDSETFEEKQGTFSWELHIEVPFSSFFKNKVKSLQGKPCKANFNKCGDDSSNPNFFCWKSIHTNEPDFHCTDYFGEIAFAKTSVKPKRPSTLTLLHFVIFQNFELFRYLVSLPERTAIKLKIIKA